MTDYILCEISILLNSVLLLFGSSLNFKLECYESTYPILGTLGKVKALQHKELVIILKECIEQIMMQLVIFQLPGDWKKIRYFTEDNAIFNFHDIFVVGEICSIQITISLIRQSYFTQCWKYSNFLYELTYTQVNCAGTPNSVTFPIILISPTLMFELELQL